MRDLAHMQVKGRVAQALISLNQKFGEDDTGHIKMHVNRQNLASYAGTTYETAFRILNDFTEDGIIRVDGNHISILDKLKISEYAKDNSI